MKKTKKELIKENYDLRLTIANMELDLKASKSDLNELFKKIDILVKARLEFLTSQKNT